jgi:hypothetical protein
MVLQNFLEFYASSRPDRSTFCHSLVECLQNVRHLAAVTIRTLCDQCHQPDDVLIKITTVQLGNPVKFDVFCNFVQAESRSDSPDQSKKCVVRRPKKPEVSDCFKCHGSRAQKTGGSGCVENRHCIGGFVSSRSRQSAATHRNDETRVAT